MKRKEKEKKERKERDRETERHTSFEKSTKSIIQPARGKQTKTYLTVVVLWCCTTYGTLL